MPTKLSRRGLLKAAGVIGAVPLLGHAPSAGAQATADQPPPRMTNESDIVRLTSPAMSVAFDKRNGTIYSITRNGDVFGTNFLGNSQNSNNSDPHWTGDLVTTIWDLKTRDWVREEPPGYSSYKSSGKWKRETTLGSADTRAVTFDGKSFAVKYSKPSGNDAGIQHYSLAMNYHLAPDNSLLWEIEIANITDRTLELGELAFPFRANDDYAGPYQGSSATTEIVAGKMPQLQKLIHEQKVFAHSFIAGHSSYVLSQRPRGDAPFLLFHCLDDTSLECIYKAEGRFHGNWIGTDFLAVHSRATHDLRDWDWNPWINGHTSLVLDPGEKKAYRFRFAFIDDYSDIQKEIAAAGNLGIRIAPSMVIQEGDLAHAELKCQSDIDNIEIHSDGAEIRDRKRTGNVTLLTLSFSRRGQKTLKVVYNGNRWTNLHFYCVEDAEQLIKARAKFMAERQFYENPADPYNRNHVFLPYDYRRGTRIDDNTDVWEVGGTDDPGFGDPLFLAEKNASFPSREEIERLEIYVSECLFKYIQNPQTYEIRASLYWKERTPSSPWGSWSKKRSESTWRTYNYAFVANIYHAMYRIGANYDVLTHRSATDYLRMCYETCLRWFVTGPYTKMGLISGSNAVNIVEDLRKEGWTAEHDKLLALMRTCNEEFIQNEYPYASEIEIDETAQHQVYFFTRYFGLSGNSESKRRNIEVQKVLKALRGGDQPVWFAYGSDLFAHPDLRGQIACWHAQSINGMCLLRAFEDTRDYSMLKKGFAGMMTVLHNLRTDGMGFGWFNLEPGDFRSEPPKTFEGGPGLWGYLRAAKSYIVDDPAFGRIGFGCRVDESEDEITVYPRDGVRKRILLVSDNINVDAMRGEIRLIVFNRKSRSLHIEMDDTTGIAKTVQLTIAGLPTGNYAVKTEHSEWRIQGSDPMRLELPIEEASSITVTRA